MSDPRTLTEIGPYRIESRLGSGGMGEVFRAYDSRLERSVAVKLIRPESSADGVARERFRREARSAAGLSHPSIVQIHDIVESVEGDAIVMELVDGELLAERIARGPLEIGESVRLAREIAAGLAAAHARQILHRDLKAENVMVTPEGHAKILDFGLAKRLDGEASVTQTAAVVGTFRAMSPEQARGMALDHRSDLFSFGSLLYEMLTGRSPFRGETTLDTLTRVCTARQAPVRELRPEVPRELAELVDRLLEKAPELRPRSAREVLRELEGLHGGVHGGMTAAEADGEETQIDRPESLFRPTGGPKAARESARPWSILSRWSWLSRRARLGLLIGTALTTALAGGLWMLMGRTVPVYVAVLAPRISKGNGIPGVDLMAVAVRSSLLDGLASFNDILPLASEQVDAVTGSPREVARAMAAEEVIDTQVSCDTVNCQILISSLRGRDSVTLWARNFTVPIEQPYLVPEVILGSLRAGYPGRSRRRGIQKLEVRAQDYEEYLRLYRSFDIRREEELSSQEILTRLAAIRQSSPHFVAAFVLEVYVLQHRFRYGRNQADLERAFQVLQAARLIAPDDPRLFLSTFETALLGVRLDLAEESLWKLERLQPGDARVLADRARLLDRRGDPQRALPLMQEAARRFPSWRHLFWAADMEYRLGRVAEARGHLDELVRRSPRNYMGLSLLAQLELFSGSAARAAELYSDLVKRSPQFGELSNLGLAQFLLRHFDEAERSYRRALALQPLNALAVLNLADVCQLLGRTAEAADLYRRTLHLAERDPAAGSDWQIASVRAQSLAHLGRNDEAVAAVQEALRLAPTNPQAAYEASLVYVLLGDRASALFNARQALHQGMEPRWFAFPWFDSLRASPELRGLLAPPPAHG